MNSIYFFEEGHRNMENILGRKGANICEMYNIGLPVPYGFIIPKLVSKQIIENAMKILEDKYGKLGKDLFVSVRSSASISMPGMMDTLLNIGSYSELQKAIEYVFNSWNNRRAFVYRENNGIPHDLSTSVIVQKMVFGNRNENSATGVIFSRNPNNGEDVLVGEILFNAQGDDIVSGLKTPIQISELEGNLYSELKEIAKNLETHFGKIQEIEFTIEDNKLFILQTRDVKNKNKIERYKIKDKTSGLIKVGIPASYGAATGKVVFDSEKAIELKQKGEDVILLRSETSPEDIEGIIACNGIITLQGGATSHAAVVARSMGKPCVCGCEEIEINEFDWITINGETGEVFLGKKELEKETGNNIKY